MTPAGRRRRPWRHRSFLFRLSRCRLRLCPRQRPRPRHRPAPIIRCRRRRSPIRPLRQRPRPPRPTRASAVGSHACLYWARSGKTDSNKPIIAAANRPPPPHPPRPASVRFSPAPRSAAASRARKSARGISRKPMSWQVGVITLPSLKAKPQSREVPVEHAEADLRGVGLARELQFGDENAADRHAIAAAGKLALVVPDFEGMREAGVKRLGIDLHDARRDPGDMPAALAVAGAGLDHAVEVAVETDGVVSLPHLPAQPLGDVHRVEEQHRALRRRPPFQRRDMGERVEPAPVAGKDRRQREIVHDAGKPGGFSSARSGSGRA